VGSVVEVQVQGSKEADEGVEREERGTRLSSNRETRWARARTRTRERTRVRMRQGAGGWGGQEAPSERVVEAMGAKMGVWGPIRAAVSHLSRNQAGRAGQAGRGWIGAGRAGLAGSTYTN
jgi:hypothetical protein